MIPKKIHYCWFGRNPLPESARKCIASWRKYLPGYEIIEWNEDNFDVNCIQYTREAYEAKKYAFVSDYARFKILYEEGGLYFDTDVEVIKSMDDIISAGPFMGFEIDSDEDIEIGQVNPGLGLGAIPKMDLYKEILDYYSNQIFINNNGDINQTTVVTRITEILINRGLGYRKGIQEIGEIKIYPSEYFNPLDDLTGKLRITKNTRSIHWFTKSWLEVSSFRTKISRFAHRIFGVGTTQRIKSLLWK